MITLCGTVHFVKKAWNLEEQLPVLSYELLWVGNHHRYLKRVNQK